MSAPSQTVCWCGHVSRLIEGDSEDDLLEQPLSHRDLTHRVGGTELTTGLIHSHQTRTRPQNPHNSTPVCATKGAGSLLGWNY
jgi:hypothetical protein